MSHFIFISRKKIYNCFYLDSFNLEVLVRICDRDYYGRIKMGLEFRNIEQNKVYCEFAK